MRAARLTTLGGLSTVNQRAEAVDGDESTSVDASSADYGLRPLEGLCVVDLCIDRAGSVAAMLLADLGADVVRVQERSGANRRPEPGVLADAVCWDRGKRTELVEQIDLGDMELQALLESADAVLIDGSPGVRETGLLAPHALAARWPRLTVCWLPGYGPRGGLHRDLPADPLLLSAVSAFSTQQTAELDVPIAPVVPVVEQVQGALGAAASVAGVLRAIEAGQGGLVVVSGLHAAAALLCTITVSAVDQQRIFRPGRDLRASPSFRPYRCGDGQWIFLAALVAPMFLAALDVLDAFEVMLIEGVDGEYSNLFDPLNGCKGSDILETRFASKPAQLWLEALRAAGVPCAPVLERSEWLGSEAFAAVGGRYEFEHAAAGTVTTPATPLAFCPSPCAMRSGDEHRWPLDQKSAGAGPLAGLQVVDLSTYLAGPFAGALLAQWGANVVKVETVAGDPYRAFGLSYLVANQGKEDVVVDLHTTEGRDILAGLIKRADVLIDNLRPSTRAKLGLGQGPVWQLNPLLVRANVTAFGSSGPFADRPGFDPIIQALSGLMAAAGGAQTPASTSTPIHDVTTGALLALGALAGVWNRTRRESGCEATTSLAASASLVQCAEFTEFSGRRQPVQGTPNFVGSSPGRRYYQASDGWLAVAVQNTEQLSALARVVNGELAAGVTVTDPDAAAIKIWASATTVADAVNTMLAAGIPCVRVLDREAWIDDPHLLANDFSHVVREPVLGLFRVVHKFADWNHELDQS